MNVKKVLKRLEDEGERKPPRVVALVKKCPHCGYYIYWQKDKPEPYKCCYCKNDLDTLENESERRKL